MAKAEAKTVDSAAAEFAEAMANMAELMRPIGEAVDGYREEALTPGIQPDGSGADGDELPRAPADADPPEGERQVTPAVRWIL